jgi:hypothetical protein
MRLEFYALPADIEFELALDKLVADKAIASASA